MTEPVLSTLLYWGYMLALGLCSRREPFWLFWWGGHMVAILAFFGLGGWAVSSIMFLHHPLFSVPLAVGVGGGGVLMALPYLWRFMERFLSESHAHLTGMKTMTVEKTYDRSEALMQQGRTEEALASVVEEFGRDPSDAEAARRAGEACLVLGRKEEAVGWWRRSLALMAPGEDRVSLVCRMVEVLEGAGRREEAHGLLHEALQAQKGTRFESILRQRLEKLSE